ncbi:hypothetical protein CBS101457_002139 [Exobasidium rhododendri]|nr:hypothetical protein CBS101457_002139 [Exobasidium rhododendri]
MISSSLADITVPVLLVLASLALSPLSTGLATLLGCTSRIWSPLSRLNSGELHSVASRKTQRHAEKGSQTQREGGYGGYIVPVQIHHARILPKESQHQFRYPSIFLAMNLKDMESGKTELNHIFTWSPLSQGKADVFRSWWKWSLTRLDPEGFGRRSFHGLKDDAALKLSKSILLKLLYELRLRGFTSAGPQDTFAEGSVSSTTDANAPWSKEVGEVWAVAMPSLLGMGGFNPLTIYYVYRPVKENEESRRPKIGKLWLVVLEVHNTFNERHVYICQVGVGEDADKGMTRRRRYHHSWTFPRAFHVSPFNDRSGYYQLFMSDLWSNEGDDDNSGIPTLDIRLLLLVDEAEERKDEGAVTDEDEEWRDSPEPGQMILRKKLLATLTSSAAKSSSILPQRLAQPLTSRNMLKALLSQPLDLLLPVSRIMWQAAKLHWKRRLPVFIRPELQGQGLLDEQESEKRAAFDGVGWPVDLNPVQSKPTKSASSGSIYWNEDGFMERNCQVQFEKYACHQTREHTNILVLLTSRNAEISPTYFYKGQKLHEEPELEIDSHNLLRLTVYMLSSSFYLDFASYTPDQARLFGSIADRKWGVSSIEIFHQIFGKNLTTSAAASAPESTWKSRVAARARRSHLKWSITNSNPHADETDHYHHIAQRLLHDIDFHPYNDLIDTSSSFVVALVLHLFLIRLTAVLSGLLHIRYVRPPWAQVGAGFRILCAELH